MNPFQRHQLHRAYSLVEILVVIGILSVILVLGYRSLSFFTRETAQLSRAAVSSRKAEFDRFVGVLNDRLSQAWAFTTESSTFGGLNGTQLALLDHEGTNYANFSLYTDGTTYVYRLQDMAVASMLDLTYAFTNMESTTEYGVVLTTNAAAQHSQCHRCLEGSATLILQGVHRRVPRPVRPHR